VGEEGGDKDGGKSPENCSKPNTKKPKNPNPTRAARIRGGYKVFPAVREVETLVRARKMEEIE